MIIGVDVSKATLDIFIKPAGLSLTIENNQIGFRKFIKQLTALSVVNDEMLVVMEHTGKYSLRFEFFLKRKGIDYCKLPALEFKKSLGIVRGKNDQVDAQRIAEYGWLRKDMLMADSFPAVIILLLKQSISLRAKMVKDRAGYIARLKEELATGCIDKNDREAKVQREVINYFTVQIRKMEAEIITLVRQHEDLWKNYQLLISIKGIGKIVAVYMIAFTDNFVKFKNARKFNCYAGLAPFKNESGSSKKGRAKVSNLACRQAKTLLDRAACSALQHDNEIKTYYQRKIAEGKAKRSCINAIKSKMVARIFAVVKRQTPFVEYKVAA